MDSYPGSVAPGNAREPCPDRIADDVGGAFAMGAIGGSVFHYFKGAFQSPKGERFIGGLTRARMDAPKTGGSFAVWGGLFSTFDCTMVYLRQKEDPWNSVIAGAATGGFLSLRQGPRQTLVSAAFGGILLGLIEGVGIMLNKMQTNMAQAQLPPIDMPAGIPNGFPFPNPNMPPQTQQAPTSDGASWGSGLFGWGKKEEGSSGMGSKDQILENFDTPSSIRQFPDQVSGEGSSSSSSWGRGLFGWGKKQDSTGKGKGDEILESFDTPSPPIHYK